MKGNGPFSKRNGINGKKRLLGEKKNQLIFQKTQGNFMKYYKVT